MLPISCINMAAVEGDFFRFRGFIWRYGIPSALGLLAMMVFAPDFVPYGYLGPLGSLALYMVTNTPKLVNGLFYMTWVVHAGEAYYGYTVAKSKGLNDETCKRWAKWIMLYGFFIMKHLLAYELKKEY